MMGSGKSTTGKILADKLGYRFLDTDEVAEYMIEKPISNFFEEGKKSASLFYHVSYFSIDFLK